MNCAKDAPPGKPNGSSLPVLKGSATPALSEAVLAIKSNSSRWAHDQGQKFAWQEGYAAFSVSASNTAAVMRYIQNQRVQQRKEFRVEGQLCGTRGGSSRLRSAISRHLGVGVAGILQSPSLCHKSMGPGIVANFRRVVLGPTSGRLALLYFCDVIRAIRRIKLSIEICVLHS